MGSMKLCLVLMLATYALAQQETESNSHPECNLTKRFKIYKKYTYQYEAEVQNGVKGTSPLKNGPKVSCKVEIEVPQACRFQLRTTECSLSEIVNVNSDGTPVYEPVDDGQNFKTAMEKNVLKFKVTGESDVTLFSDGDETNILNIKRGIVSALIVPVMENEQTKDMATVHGICATEVKVNAREDIATDVTITRDLSGCDHFKAQRNHYSPLALITGLQYPLTKLIGSSQSCTYKFDNQKQHMTSATCTEKHIFLPFSYQNEYGISSLVKQTLTLQETSKINDRVFDFSPAHIQYLALEAVQEKNGVQTSEALMTIFRELKSMHEQPQGNQRADVFQKLVSELRGLELEAVKEATAQMVEEDKLLTWQVLVQCGTPECASSMLGILKMMDSDVIEVDAVVYALGMMHSPTGLMVKDILEIAKIKKSKSVMYALSNVVRRHLEAEGKVTPEILEVYEFISSILGSDCAGEKELTFLTLRVLGNMGEAMEAADSNIKNILLRCMRQPTTTLSIQLAAIQAFRRMSLTPEVRSNIQRVAVYGKGAVQKRLAAYLILMRNPEASDIEVVKKILTQDQNTQVKSFVASHVYNIVHSTDPEVEELGKKIMEVMEDNEVLTHSNYTQLSRNYKMDAFMPGIDTLGSSAQSSVIFDPSSLLPREVMFETTLKAFGYNLDLIEFGMEGKGFEPTVETIFGSNGFFPDTISKTMYWVGDKMPDKINEILQEWVEPLRTEKTKRQVPENIVREVVRNFNKLVRDLSNQESPEAMAYLRIMGNELGYIKGTSELSAVVDRMTTYIQTLKYSPAWIAKTLMSGDQNIFAHYIFMDNDFSLPTSSGFPLKFSMSGIFAPGVKGGLQMKPGKGELSFSPSMEVKFVTHMGIHMPKYVVSAVEMHTKVFHESSFNAKVTMGNGQLKLSIPAPKDTTQLFKASNQLVMVSKTQAQVVSDTIVNNGLAVCNSLISGISYCVSMSTSEAGADSPYFPLNGQSNFAVTIQPTGEVTEYTATFEYEVMNEAGGDKVNSLKMILRAEGAEPAEATATVKYSRGKNTVTTSIEIPDYDVEAGIKVGFTESDSNVKKITFDITNKNIPQLSLIGRAKYEPMKDGLLEAQLIVPSLDTDATLSATMSHDDGLTVELQSNVKLPETNSVQKIILQYGDEEMKVQLKSDMDSEIQNQLNLQQVFDDIMEYKVVKTDMKLRHICAKFLEAYQIWVDKMSADMPYLKNLRRNIPELTIPSMPERVYMNTESTFKYKFNKDRVIITIPLPFGGKTSEDLRIPPTMSTPDFAMPQFGLMVPSKQFDLPTFSIPSSYDLSTPLLGMVEVSAKVNTNFYDIEAVFSGGNKTENEPAYIASYKVVANSPMEILAFAVNGTAQIGEISRETAKYEIGSSLKHKLLDAYFNLMETATITDVVKTTGNFKVGASSPLGMKMSLEYTAQSSISSEISGDGNLDGSLKVGPFSASTVGTQTFLLQPANREARAESSFRVSSSILKFRNKMKASVANGKLSFDSNTNINNDLGQRTAVKRTLRNQVEFSATVNEVTIKFETQADDSTNRAFSLLAGSLNAQGLELNSDATINFDANRASHKGTLSFTNDGLTTSCTTNAQMSTVTFENIFHGGIASSGATMSLSTKGSVQDNSIELKVEGGLTSSEAYFNSMYKGDIFNANTRSRITAKLNKDGLNLSNNIMASLQEIKIENTDSLELTLKSLTIRSESDNSLNENNYYKHNIAVDLRDFTASLNVNNDLKVIGFNFINDAQMKATLYKMEITGTLKGTFDEEELTHKYEINIADMTASAKCTSNGRLLGTQMSQSSEIEIVGYSSKFSNEVRFNSPSLRLESNVLTKAEPFKLDIESSFNSDGELNLYGKHSGEMNSMLLIRAEPLSFSHNYQYKASTSHQLNDENTIKTNFQNEITSDLTPIQSNLNIKMESKLNDHAFGHTLKIFDTPENIGISLLDTVSTNLLNKNSEENQEFSISGDLKYQKNGNSHLITLPFVEKLPELAEEVKTAVLNMKERSIDTISDFNDQYDITDTLQSKTSQLLDAIKEADAKLYNSLRVASTQVSKAVPEINFQHFFDNIEERTAIVSRIKDICYKVDEILKDYEIEAIVEKNVNDVVELMKQYKARGVMQSAVNYLNFPEMYDSSMEQVNELSKQLYTKGSELIDYDYDTLADQVRQKVTDLSVIEVPCFGTLSGKFEMKASEHTLMTSAELKNSTEDSAKFTAVLNSEFQTPIDLLAYTFDATAHLTIPEINDVSLTETVKANHMSFSFDHQGSLSMNSALTQASSKTTAKATTDPYTADFVNNAFLSTKNGLSGTLDTSYNHNVHMPVANIFSQVKITQKAVAQLQSGIITITVGNEGTGKCSIFDFSNEGTHKSDLEILLSVKSSKLIFNGDTDSSLYKMKQKVDAETVGLTQLKFNAHAETETPFIKKSVAAVKGQFNAMNLMMELSGSHSAELTGKVEGTIVNSVTFKAMPYEIVFDIKNKENTKLMLPFELSGKVDLQNDMSLTLSPVVQKASWTGLARFNQYKYSHYMTMANEEKEVRVSASVNGEADLSVLTLRVNIPKMTIPIINKETPEVEQYSIWEDAGLKRILITPQQTFDMDATFSYVKNPEMFNMEPMLNDVINKINFVRDSVVKKCPYFRKMTLPNISKAVMIPVMGDLAYELSVKTAMITMNTKAEILNQDEMVAQFESRLTSEFEVLNGKTSGKAALNRNSGIKLLTNMNVEHKYFENSYNGLLESANAVVSNAAKVNLPNGRYMLYHKLTKNAEDGLIVSVSSPSAGLLGLQLQCKGSTQHTGRLFGSFNSEDNVDILKVNVAVMDSNRLNFQTQWNKEISAKILTWLKKSVASLKGLKDTMANYINAVYKDISKKYEDLEITIDIDQVKNQAKLLYKRAAERISAADLGGISKKISDNIVIILRAYQKNVQTLLEAAIAFMRDTQFQLPGHSEKLSGLEIYNKISVFVADVIEEAMVKLPEMFSKSVEAVTERIREIEIAVPGSTYVINGGDLLDDLHAVLQKIQSQIITVVKRLGEVRFETVVQKVSEILKFTVEKAEELLNNVKFQDFDKLTAWISTVYKDAVNSDIVREVAKQVETFRRIIVEYYKTVKAKAQDIFAEMTTEQLIADFNAWIESVSSRLRVLIKQIIVAVNDAIEDGKSYVRVSDNELDIDIQLQPVWDFFSRLMSMF